MDYVVEMDSCGMIHITQYIEIVYVVQKIIKNSVILVRKRTIPTEGPPLIGEV
jgi:hypothetical protein